ncbi:hypothetical protein L3X38_041975 [Prunus dulcis]|uniref:Uncharacterized protein n=1 Tax=Prunus dulcis TaxID=3755 RepID=A0AAD4YKS7_PRUDU|nr:hypothetical protein L3X38_041975 [Prunus dulcis]
MYSCGPEERKSDLYIHSLGKIDYTIRGKVHPSFHSVTSKSQSQPREEPSYEMHLEVLLFNIYLQVDFHIFKGCWFHLSLLLCLASKLYSRDFVFNTASLFLLAIALDEPLVTRISTR